ncbi:hypothetical protein GQR58_030088 [Nymphon striatum]|nr:hypothetical protein GQR58_030088 [Nymphon striatum]
MNAVPTDRIDVARHAWGFCSERVLHDHDSRWRADRVSRDHEPTGAQPEEHRARFVRGRARCVQPDPRLDHSDLRRHQPADRRCRDLPGARNGARVRDAPDPGHRTHSRDRAVRVLDRRGHADLVRGRVLRGHRGGRTDIGSPASCADDAQVLGAGPVHAAADGDTSVLRCESCGLR